MVCKIKVELLTATLHFKGVFFIFQNRSVSFSYGLNLPQNSSVNHTFSIALKTLSNCPWNVQQLAPVKSIFCQVRLMVDYRKQLVTKEMFNE